MGKTDMFQLLQEEDLRYAIQLAARPLERPTNWGECRGGKASCDKRGYVLDVLWETTGECWTDCSPSRSKVNCIDFLCAVDAQVPAHSERIYAILDNLDTHHQMGFS
jgi:hypothetical protein